MKKKLKKLLASVMAVSMTMSLLSVTAFADESGDPPADGDTTTVADPYIYYYNSYDWHVSPHFLTQSENNDHEQHQNNGYGDTWAILFRLDDVYPSSQLGNATETVAAYCSDLSTNIQRYYPYNAYKRINLEDSTYYDDDSAAYIRGIFEHGYWHDWTAEDLANAQKDANEWLADQHPEITETDPATGEVTVIQSSPSIKGLTNAQALSATQAAIWHFANESAELSYCCTVDQMINLETTLDHTKVPLNETADENTENNINLFIEYLTHQKKVQPDQDSILFSDNQFVSTSAVFTTAGETNYDVTVGFQLVGEVESDDDLKVTATLGHYTITKNLVNGTDALTADEDGNYFITFHDLPYEEINEESERQITLNLSGTQLADGVYFYEAKPAGGDSARETSQNLVGKYTGTTIVSATAEIKFDLGTKEITLYKYDSDRETGIDETEATVTVNDKAYAAIKDVAFDLYARDESAKHDYLLKSGLKTDENGKISVSGLPTGYTYFFKETTARPGYDCDLDYEHEVKDANGVITVANCYDTASLTLSKMVEGVPTDQHFTFTIELDLSEADLQNAETLIDTTFPADWDGAACLDGETPIHSDSIKFTLNGKLLTAEVQLKHGETLTISEIPTGTKYTVTEDASEYTPECGNDTGNVGEETITAVAYNNVKYNSSEDGVKVQVKKTVDGEAPHGTFTFELHKFDAETGVWGTTPMDTAQNDASGNVVFNDLGYSRPSSGDIYRIQEQQGTGDYVYDNSTFYAVVRVTSDKDGDLSSQITYYTEKDWDTQKNIPKGDGSTEPPTFNNISFKDGNFYLSGQKYLNGDLSSKAFTFILTDVTDPENPVEVATATNGANGTFQFNDIAVADAGTYTYQLKEKSVSGYHCDDTVYTITVTAERNGDALDVTVTGITAAVEEEVESETVTVQKPVETMEFYNTSKTSGGSTPANWKLTAEKTLNGQPASGYVFQMVDEDGKVTRSSSKDGKITFPSITYTKKGTYTYTITEAAGDEEGIIYDDSTYTVTVTIGKEGRTYQVDGIVIEKDGETADKVLFENKTTTEEIPDEETPKDEKPETPDTPDTPDSPDKSTGTFEELEELPEDDVPLADVPATGDLSALWLALSALSATGLVGLTIAEKKRKDD